VSHAHLTAFALVKAARKKGGMSVCSSSSLLLAGPSTERTPNSEPFIGVAEVSQIFGLPASWIEWLTVRRHLTHYTFPGLGVAYRSSEIERDLQKFKSLPSAIAATGSAHEHEPAA